MMAAFFPASAWAQGPEVATVSVAPATRHQTIEGFGTCLTTFFRPQAVYASPAFLDFAVHDLGLSMVRLSIPEFIERINDDGDPHRFHWDGYVMAGRGSRWSLPDRMALLQEFKNRGIERFLATPWSPPDFTKTNRAPTDGGYLRIDRVDEYAEFMAAFIILAKHNWGIDFNWITTQNELLFTQSFRSCVDHPQMVREKVRALMGKFEREGIRTLILTPEDMMSAHRMRESILPLMADPQTREFPGHFTTHRQGGAEELRKWRSYTDTYGRQNWMTETSGHAQTWDGALRMAIDMHEYLVDGNFSAWVYWQLVDSPRAGVYCLVTAEGDRWDITPKYHAARHFYRFVRPGAVRVESSATLTSLRASAFVHDVDGTLSIVLVNESPEQRSVELALEGPGLPTTWRRVESTEAAGSRELDPLGGPGLTLPPRSITTLVGEADVLRTRDALDPLPPSWDDPDPDGPWLGDFQSDHRDIGWTELHQAILTGREERAAELVRDPQLARAATEDGWTPLHMAAATFRNPKVRFVEMVLEAGGDLDARTVEGFTPLHAAAMSSHTLWREDPRHNLDRLCRLVHAGAGLEARDATGKTPLHWAAWQGSSELVRVQPQVVMQLIELGADVNAVDARGRTPLHYAAEMGYVAIVRALLAGGADPAARDAEGQTPAEAAQARALTDIVQVIEVGPDAARAALPPLREDQPARSIDDVRSQALVNAAWNGNLDRVRQLLAEGADPHWRDRDGFTALDRARDNNHTEVMALLREAQ